MVLIVSFLFLLVFLSLLPRSVEVVNGNYLFLLDQGRDYLAVKNIVVNRKFTLIGAEAGYGVAGIQGIFHGPFYFYLLSIPFLLFRGDPYGGLLLMFVFGILTIIMGFFLGKKLFGFIGGMTTSLLIASSPPLIAQSRFVWSPHPSTFFILLAFFFVFFAAQGRRITIFFASFFSGFLYNFELAIAIPLSLGLVVHTIFIARFRKVDQYMALFSGFFLAYLPMILFEIRHGFQSMRGIITYLSVNKPQSFIFVTSEKLGWVFRTFADTFPKQELFPQILLLFLFLLSSVYFITKEKKRKLRLFFYYLLSLFAVTFVTFLFIRTHIFEYYLIHLNLALIIFFSYIFVSSFEKKAVRFQLLLSTILFVLLFSASLHAFNTFRKDLSDYGGMAKVKGRLDAIDYIYGNAKGEKFGLLVFSPPVYTFAYDYLVWWYGQKRYGYVPHQKKVGLFYLLIEKDLGQPWTYKGWLETVVKTGTVLEIKELPSGFIIEKRVGNGNAA